MSAPKLELVHLSPTADSRNRWADGTLKGIKMLKLDWRRENGERRYIVCSPHQGTEWTSALMLAKDFAEGTEVRGAGGIHAIWPPSIEEDCAALGEWDSYRPKRKDEFTVLVSGWGRAIMGDVGWRAEHVRLRTIIQPPKQNAMKLRQWCREHGVKWSVL